MVLVPGASDARINARWAWYLELGTRTVPDSGLRVPVIERRIPILPSAWRAGVAKTPGRRKRRPPQWRYVGALAAAPGPCGPDLATMTTCVGEVPYTIQCASGA